MCQEHDRLIWRAERRCEPGRRREIDLRHLRLVPDRREPIDAAAAAVEIPHLMTADSRVVPVGDEEGTIGRRRDICRPGPGVVAAVHDVLADGREAGAVRRQRIHFDESFAGIGMKELSAILGRQQRALIDKESARRSRAKA